MSEALESRDLTASGKVLLLLSTMALAGGWLAGDDHARLASALLGAPLLLDYLLKPRGLRRVRIFASPLRTEAGAPFVEELRISHDATLREVVVRDPRVHSRSGSAIESLRAGRTLALSRTGRSRQRSHLLERTFEIESLWPLGFIRAMAIVRVPTEIVTEPARIALEPALLRAALDRDPGPDADRQRHGPDYHSLREYAPGEDARAVHAGRSQALGTLVRRITSGDEPEDVGMVIDLRRPIGLPLALGQRRFEWCLSAAATLVDSLYEKGVRVRVLVIASRAVRTVIEGADKREEFGTFLAEAPPCPHRPSKDLAAPRGGACYWIPAGGHVDRPALAAFEEAILVTPDEGIE
ncbi:MAG: hypothetical protein Fur0037_20970 [Planctomycetota bacterium]